MKLLSTCTNVCRVRCNCFAILVKDLLIDNIQFIWFLSTSMHFYNHKCIAWRCFVGNVLRAHKNNIFQFTFNYEAMISQECYCYNRKITGDRWRYGCSARIVKLDLCLSKLIVLLYLFAGKSSFLVLRKHSLKETLCYCCRNRFVKPSLIDFR